MLRVTDATYWTGEVGNIPRRFLKKLYVLRQVEPVIILVDVLPREVVEILATLA